jgi:O-antigen ligase
VVFIAHRIPRPAMGVEDLFFAAFVLCVLLSFKLNAASYPEGKGLTQLANLVLTYLFFKITLAVMIKSEPDKQELLRKIFKINSIFQIFAVLVFIAGLIHGEIFENVAVAFNNSGNFHIGAVGVSWNTARSFGFSPEPSFWSFFIAMNIALAFVIPKPNKFLLGINFLNLFLTLGRTGFLMLIAILIIRFSKRSALTKVFLVVVMLVAAFTLADYFVLEKFRAVDISIQQRIDSILVGLRMFRQHPLFGMGFGNFPVYAQNQGYEFFDIFNLFLNVLVSSGIVGSLFFVGVLVAIFSKIQGKMNLPFYGAVVGWLTVSAYNLPFAWVMFAALMYASKREVVSEEDSLKETSINIAP